MAKFRRLSRELGGNDQLVVHYAGHSLADRRTGKSYWLPSNTRVASAQNFVSTDAVYRMLQDMGLRGALILSDGKFQISRSSRTIHVATPRKIRVERARTPVSVVTSGLGRPVRAMAGDSHSAFTWRLGSTLSDIGGSTRAQDLFQEIRNRLIKNRLAADVRL